MSEIPKPGTYYRCLACDLEFRDAATANAHHDATGHFQTHRRRAAIPTPAALPARETETRIHGVTWLLLRDGCVLLERCPKKAKVLGVGEWFVPGGKLEAGETTEQALRRELSEEWPGAELLTAKPLPLVEGSAVPPGPRGLFLMRPYVVTVSFDRRPDGATPEVSGDGVELRWTPIAEALASPVLQVRMMVAAALVPSEPPASPAGEATPEPPPQSASPPAEESTPLTTREKFAAHCEEAAVVQSHLDDYLSDEFPGDPNICKADLERYAASHRWLLATLVETQSALATTRGELERVVAVLTKADAILADCLGYLDGTRATSGMGYQGRIRAARRRIRAALSHSDQPEGA